MAPRAGPSCLHATPKTTASRGGPRESFRQLDAHSTKTPFTVNHNSAPERVLHRSHLVERQLLAASRHSHVVGRRTTLFLQLLSRGGNHGTISRRIRSTPSSDLGRHFYQRPRLTYLVRRGVPNRVYVYGQGTLVHTSCARRDYSRDPRQISAFL